MVVHIKRPKSLLFNKCQCVKCKKKKKQNYCLDILSSEKPTLKATAANIASKSESRQMQLKAKEYFPI